MINELKTMYISKHSKCIEKDFKMENCWKNLRKGVMVIMTVFFAFV